MQVLDCQVSAVEALNNPPVLLIPPSAGSHSDWINCGLSPPYSTCGKNRTVFIFRIRISDSDF